MRKLHRVHWVVAALIALALWHFGQGAYIHAKARLAQYLVRAAWERTLAGAREVKPWPGAESWPVARLMVRRHGIDVFVLAGGSGRTMAYGPGHVFGTPQPGTTGNSVISAHRDSHLAFLRRLQPGDEILVETSDGVRKRYAVDGARVVDRRDMRVVPPEPTARLTLVTRYPFDALTPRGSLRYVVNAAAI